LTILDREIERLQAREQAGEFDQLDPALGHRFKIGDAIVLTAGPFIDKPGVIESVLNRDRVRVQVNGFSLIAPASQLRKRE
jgi:transcription antitermination factor NusG